jgi:hypothetical protein
VPLPDRRAGFPLPAPVLLACCVQSADAGRGGVSPRTVPRHAAPQAVGRWAGRLVELGLLRPPAGAPAPQSPGPSDPLVHPIAVTEHCVLGDQIRVPAAWCDTAGCTPRFADPAALGEADNRARALIAGWSADALSQLVCPACQERHGVAGPRRLPGQGVAGDGGPTPAAARPGPGHGGGSPARPMLTRWLGTVRLGRHRRAPCPHLLAALASDLSGWDARHPFIVASPGKKMGPGGQRTSTGGGCR